MRRAAPGHSRFRSRPSSLAADRSLPHPGAGAEPFPAIVPANLRLRYTRAKEGSVGNFLKISVGKAELVALQDSWFRRPPGGFFEGIDDDAWGPYRDWLGDDGLFAHNFGTFAIISEGKTMIVDTGLGQWPNPLDLKMPASLPSVMEEAGIPPAEVDLVLFTHLHWDHSGWNTRGPQGALELTFPNARYVVHEKEYAWWTEPGAERPGNGPKVDLVLKPLVEAGVLDLVDGEHAATSEVVMVPTPGHTPGHVAFGISSAGEHAYVVGDAAHKPVQLTEPDWYPGFDIDPVESTMSRHLILDRAERDNAVIAAGHFAFPSMGRSKRVDGTRVFEYLADWQR